MPRVARIVVPGLPHHVIQRGNNRQNVFFTDDDRKLYLSLLKQQSQRFRLSIISYCLMANHVHLIVTPRRADSLAKAVGRTHWLYTQAINKLHGRSGHLWQNRFFSCALADDHLLHAVCYVERNPVRARVARLAWRYRWSSAAAHAGEAKDAFGVLDRDAWKMYSPAEWRRMLQREDEQMVKRLESSLRTGRPLASDGWLAKLESKLNRRLRVMPVGRPARKGAKSKRSRMRKGRNQDLRNR